MTGESVVDFRPASTSPDSGVVDLLESALERAKAGELRSVAIVGNLSGGNFMSSVGWARGENDRLLGQLEFARWEICRIMSEGD